MARRCALGSSEHKQSAIQFETREWLTNDPHTLPDKEVAIEPESAAQLLGKKKTNP